MSQMILYRLTKARCVACAYVASSVRHMGALAEMDEHWAYAHPGPKSEPYCTVKLLKALYGEEARRVAGL